MLIIAIDDAEAEFQSYITVTTMDNELTLHLLNIIKFNCFNFLHGDTEFDSKPNIVREYEMSIELLEKALVKTGNVKMAAKDRQFVEWFSDNKKLWYE